MSLVNADELFSAEDLPNDLILVEVIEEDCRVPAIFDRIWPIIFIFSFAIKLFLEERCEDESPTNLVAGNAS